MLTGLKLLEQYVQGVLRLSRARSVSLFIPAPSAVPSAAVLLHAGEGLRVPELADATEAAAFAKATVERGESFRGLVESRDPDAVLLALRPVDLEVEKGSEAPAGPEPAGPGRRRLDARAEDAVPACAGWLGLRLSPGPGKPVERLVGAVDASVPTGRPASPMWNWIMALGGRLAEHEAAVYAATLDPVSGLPGRSTLHVMLDDELGAAREGGHPLGLLSINPDSFTLVNERFGREAADEILREFVARIRSGLRTTDRLARFGGVTFLAILPGATLAESTSIGEKIRRSVHDTTFREGAVRLTASIGVSAYDPERKDASRQDELLRRADQALGAAKRSGGNQVAAWKPGSEAADARSFDRLSGIFTGRMSVDYRNMGLLWDAMNIMARLDDLQSLATQVVERIDGAFAARRTALFIRTETGAFRFLSGVARRAEGDGLLVILEDMNLSPMDESLIDRAASQGRPIETVASAAPEAPGAAPPTRRVVTPLLSRGLCLGALFLESDRSFDMADMTFLGGLGHHLGAALERIQLTAETSRREKEERRRLETELTRYRRAADRAQLLYRSPSMHGLLARTQQVAATDATVLIMGESGTGKELLARTLHDLSPRRQTPLVVVDCSAIAATLADSELFGHEAGAYTGAQQRRGGRLAEADGGTVLLDEIGELPLDVQGKLLRFVQEKQLTAVGSSKVKKVDVRILAATNRDLAAEVAAGRFRQDLFHRLNVVSLVIPPLRDRADDVLHLAEHFLGSLSTLYRKEARRLSPAATVSLLRHDWPGNVRELQHRIMQAVIFSPHEELGPSDLGFAPAGAEAAPGVPPSPSPGTEPGEETASRRRRRPSAPSLQQDPWAALRAELSKILDAIARRRPPVALPLGRWLATDLVLEADTASEGIARRGAALLGIPEATFRHRLQKAKNEVQSGQAARPAEWNPARTALSRIAALPRPDGEDRLERAEKILIEEIRAHVPTDDQLGSLLLGVTTPTFQRRAGPVPH